MTEQSTYSDTATFRGADFRRADLSGARFRDCNLASVRIASSWVDDLRITGFDGSVGTVHVDDVDVSAYVREELDRRHPERVVVRAARSADELRAAWAELERLWDGTVERAGRLPEAVLHERVDDEWSFVETVRHLVFAVDTWVGRMILGEPAPNDPIGLPPTDMAPAATEALGLDPAAHPTAADALAVHAARRARFREVLGGLRDEKLDTPRSAVLEPPDGVEERTLRECVTTLLREHSEHRRFAVRDLAVLEARDGGVGPG
ncbi:DinB family protein [Actinotalea ferrariae]|uniref:DinB family protein n=1 Tax=Actinotalea ferrariae TaxID=1386098 RepID=UPI001C8C6439|nr:DinB family protein [Actinotalea ferrariae]MBX9245398.1 DinB family protein [Actinotalea ferrariae]